MRCLIAAALLLALPGCVSVSETTRISAPACQVGEPMVETMLFLGMARPNGSVSRRSSSRRATMRTAFWY